MTKTNGLYKGSGRSPKGYDIFSLIKPHSDLLESFGGHKQACGITLKEENLERFLEVITESSKGLSVDFNEDPYLTLDTNELDIEAYEQFASLEPYGVDFIKPQLKVSVTTNNYPTVLAEKYLKWRVNGGIDLISFDKNLDLDHYKNIKDISAMVDLSLNEYMGRKTINLIIQEFI